MVRACKKCLVIVEKGNDCPICKSKDLGTNIKGQIVVFNPNHSRIAERIHANSPGEYAIRVKS
ncbi:DNA-directed RNA polymerase subunit E'' [archaeon CG10_big_fil_rev_8_21_14_0_10_43_11]|nr:MAG: DNA-directed RNA polymerase subunit E'' [archaeon CG10_big_fil_rev_8_21_14_0_10_43_11]